MTIDLGVPGIDAIEPGDHVCGLYRGEAERDVIMVAFLRAGLVSGDTCLCLIDQAAPSEVVGKVSNGRDARAHVETGQLRVERATGTYLRSGAFSADAMVDLLVQEVASARDGDHPQFRAVGEMSWVFPGAPGTADLFRYEGAINEFAATYLPVLLCLYDLDLFGGSMADDLLRTHPKVLLGGLVLENPHYLSPDVPAGATPARRPPDAWDQLTAGERTVAEGAARGMTSAEIARELLVSAATIEAHLRNIRTRLDLDSHESLTRCVLRHLSHSLA